MKYYFQPHKYRTATKTRTKICLLAYLQPIKEHYHLMFELPIKCKYAKHYTTTRK